MSKPSEVKKLARELLAYHRGFPNEGPSIFSEGSAALIRQEAAIKKLTQERNAVQAVVDMWMPRVEAIRVERDALKAELAALKNPAAPLGPYRYRCPRCGGIYSSRGRKSMCLGCSRAAGVRV